SLRARRPSEQAVHELGGEDPAGPALVDRGADVGGAFDVFRVGEPSGDGLPDVGDRLVSLPLDVPLLILAVADHPDGEGGGHIARGAPNDGEPVRPRAVVLEARLLFVVAQADAETTRELDGRVPAAADGERVPWDRGALAVSGGHRDAGER